MSNKLIFKCYFCNKDLLGRSHYNHLRLHLKEKPFRCHVPNCTKSLQYSAKLLRHIRLVHRGPFHQSVIKCPLCPSEFKTVQYANLHLRHMHKVSDFLETPPQVCPTCGKTFKINSHLVLHMRRMHRFRPKKQFCCGLCQDSFDTVANLAIHKKKKHPDKVTQAELRSNCGICGKDLNVISMSIHMVSNLLRNYLKKLFTKNTFRNILCIRIKRINRKLILIDPEMSAIY